MIFTLFFVMSCSIKNLKLDKPSPDQQYKNRTFVENETKTKSDEPPIEDQSVEVFSAIVFSVLLINLSIFMMSKFKRKKVQSQ